MESILNQMFLDNVQPEFQDYSLTFIYLKVLISPMEKNKL